MWDLGLDTYIESKGFRLHRLCMVLTIEVQSNSDTFTSSLSDDYLQKQKNFIRKVPVSSLFLQLEILELKTKEFMSPEPCV